MSILIDLIIVSIVLLFVITSAKKGFVKVIISVIGFIAAIVLAFTFSGPLAEFTYDKLIEPPILKTAEISSTAIAEDTIQNSWDSLPSIIKKNSALLGISEQSFNESVSGNITNGLENALKTTSVKVIRPVAVKILGMLFSIILSLVLIIISHFLSKIINKIFSFSLVGKLNTSLGGILGLIKGSAVAILFCTIISFIVPLTANGFLIFTAKNIEGSIIFKFLANLIPFSIF